MPVEFSVACYRFGHSMIRNVYDYNRNFGRKPDGSAGFVASRTLPQFLFLFTGKSPTPVRRPYRAADVCRTTGSSSGTASTAAHARPGRRAGAQDRHPASPPTLGDMPNEGNDPTLDAP